MAAPAPLARWPLGVWACQAQSWQGSGVAALAPLARRLLAAVACQGQSW